MTFNLLFLPILTFSLSLLVTGGVRYYALHQSLIDIPNERSSHTQPTPRGGGLGFIIAFLVALLFTAIIPQFNFPADLFLPLILLPLAIIGFLDDRYNLPSSIRYLVQLGTALIAVVHYGSFPQPWLSNLGLSGEILVIAFTGIGFTALVNFYNFMDGLDGFITTITVLQLSFIALYLQQPLWWLLIASLLGFLYWNWSPAKIFMGDVGSTVLGAVMAIALIQVQDPTLAWSSLAITLPITADTIYTLVVRLTRRENIFQAHRTHIFQRLQQSGWSHAQVTLTYSALMIAIAVLIFIWGAIGSIISVVITILGIIVVELYLTRTKAINSLAS
jgi:UDP-N-acetylmuramyl pentapeptide phosphotransferase/UDP-N-acetylglucosamine-1-phosphate transferase